MSRECITHHMCDCKAEALTKAEAERDAALAEVFSLKFECTNAKSALQSARERIEKLEALDSIKVGIALGNKLIEQQQTITRLENALKDIDGIRVKEAPKDIMHIADKLRWLAREALGED